MKKKIAIIFTILCLLTSNACVFASVSWETIEGQADDFIGMASDIPPINVDETISDVGEILTTIGLTVVLIGILILGIKYMLATPEEAAKIKGQLIGLVVAAVVIFGAGRIWSLVVNALQSL